LGFIRRGATDRVVAFVLESKNPLWLPKMLKATFDATAYPDLFTANCFMGNHESVGATAKISGGLLSIPVTASGKEDVITLVKNYPANISGGPGSSPAGEPVGSASGTGFVVGRNLIVTCNHVIQNAKRIEIAFDGAKDAFPLEVVVQDDANDLAVLRVLPNEKGTYPVLTAVPMADTSLVRLGQPVFTIGFPLGALLGEEVKVTDGSVSALSGLKNDPRMLQVSVPVQPGNSGGPLFDEHGSAVGVVVASLSASYLYQNTGALPQNVNFAVRSDYVLALLRRVAKDSPLTASPLTNVSRVDQIERLRRSVGQVRAFNR
jgi:S1-C subfamily serine protease